MDKNSAVLSPIQAQERIASLDIIRGIAVLGILVMNILEFGLPHQALGNPTVYGGAEGANLWAWIVMMVGFEGTQRGLFTLMFGASVIVFTQRLEASQHPNAADLYFRRNLWLVVFGLVNGFILLWIHDILFIYGVTALFVYAFRKAAPATLLLIALGGFVAHAVWNELDRREARQARAGWEAAVAAEQAGQTPTAEQQEAKEAWEARLKAFKPTAEELRKEIEGSRASYFRQVAYQAPLRSQFQSYWLYRHFFDQFSMMLIGMALFKLGLFRLGRPTKIYWRMVLLGYGIGLTVNILEVRQVIEGNFSLSALAGGLGGFSYDIGRVATTIGHVGLLMLLCNAPILGGLKRRLAAVGQMAFTNYISQSIIGAFIFFGVGFALFGQLQRYQLYYVVLGMWAFQLIVSPIWLRHFRYGPLEWLWRSLTYGKRQPMRRSAGETLPAAQPS